MCASVTEEDAVRDALKGADAAARPRRTAAYNLGDYKSAGRVKIRKQCGVLE